MTLVLVGGLLVAVPDTAQVHALETDTGQRLASPALTQTSIGTPADAIDAPPSAVAPTRVSEVMSERTAASSTWLNDDGSMTVDAYAAPQFYKPSDSAPWAPIDSTAGEYYAASGSVAAFAYGATARAAGVGSGLVGGLGTGVDTIAQVQCG